MANTPPAEGAFLAAFDLGAPLIADDVDATLRIYSLIASLITERPDNAAELIAKLIAERPDNAAELIAKLIAEHPKNLASLIAECPKSQKSLIDELMPELPDEDDEEIASQINKHIDWRPNIAASHIVKLIAKYPDNAASLIASLIAEDANAASRIRSLNAELIAKRPNNASPLIASIVAKRPKNAARLIASLLAECPDNAASLIASLIAERSDDRASRIGSRIVSAIAEYPDDAPRLLLTSFIVESIAKCPGNAASHIAELIAERPDNAAELIAELIADEAKIDVGFIPDDADNAGPPRVYYIYSVYSRSANVTLPDGKPEAHRLLMTGWEHGNPTAVRGRLLHVVHGIMGGGSTRPATLVVFEWLLVPGSLGKRFREVNIDVTFAAHGPRSGVGRGGDLFAFDPSPLEVAPSVQRDAESTSDVTVESTVAANIGAGYGPFVSASAEMGRKTTKVTRRTDFRFMAGYPELVGRDFGNPNSVHWTFRENVSGESGVPSLVRTAVLLQRNVGDDSGMFFATIKTSAKTSVVADGIMSLKKLVRLVPRDEPVYFDPKPIPGVTHGAAVLYGKKAENVVGKNCPFDKDNLAGVDLMMCLAPDDDKKAAAPEAGNEE